jgi:hypothetical protein
MGCSHVAERHRFDGSLKLAMQRKAARGGASWDVLYGRTGNYRNLRRPRRPLTILGRPRLETVAVALLTS